MYTISKTEYVSENGSLLCFYSNSNKEQNSGCDSTSSSFIIPNPAVFFEFPHRSKIIPLLRLALVIL